MKDEKSQGEKMHRDDETMARLLKIAGPSAPVPEDIEARVYEEVHRDWRASTQAPDDSNVYNMVRKEWSRGRRSNAVRRWAMPVALAASMVLALTVLLQPSPITPVTSPAIGTIARVIGNPSNGDLLEGRSIDSGDVVQTGPGEGVSILMSRAESVRLDENSRLQFDSANEFTLLGGRMYADTGSGVYHDRSLVVTTPMGVVTDVGTQFVVDLDGRSLDVGVREGRVDVAAENEVYIAVAGERMQLTEGEDVNIGQVAAHDAYWDWATQLAPVFEIENRSLLEFLRWAARETGRELVFENNELRMAAMRVDLHGSVSDFSPLEAVESVLAGTNFRYSIESDRIVIRE